ncbi:hypothetical protein [Ruegeria marina]|uniref:PH domain-containing protein n=1 Tax=Ruegeria marina TaxID=639004 RepID=A0A1G6N6C6_9RHOB|nr:hypothetical protein [Ruegeria marina]SDC62984.1 hypothetical protein SAMN04488239_10340 [Ruegeria marina]
MPRDSEQPDVSGETRVGRDWPRSVGLPIVCLFLVAVAAYGVSIEPDSWPSRRFHSGSFVILPVFLVFAPLSLYRLIRPWGAPVRLGPQGFVDLRAGRDIIPWDQITNVVARGEFVTLTLRRGFVRTYRISLGQRLLKAMRKSAGPGHLLVAGWCLSRTPSEMADMINAYRSAYAGQPAKR